MLTKIQFTQFFAYYSLDINLFIIIFYLIFINMKGYSKKKVLTLQIIQYFTYYSLIKREVLNKLQILLCLAYYKLLV